jgi:hypothetical protein
VVWTRRARTGYVGEEWEEAGEEWEEAGEEWEEAGEEWEEAGEVYLAPEGLQA